MKNIYRHGDLCLKEIDKLPKNLKKETTKVLMSGSRGNPHSYDNGEFYLKNVDNFIFGYFVAKNTILTHIEHGEGKQKLRVAKIGDGIYELRKQFEFVNKELKQVID